MSQWSEKYRPTRLSEYVPMEKSIQNVAVEWIENPMNYPHLLLHGPTGTGKTTLAKVIQNELDEVADSLFLYASIENGMDMLRDRIVTFCDTGSMKDMKLVILDEADRLSVSAQDALRNVMDKYNSYVRFLFTCNNVNSISAPVRGRCVNLDVSAPDRDAFEEFLIMILVEENIDEDLAEKAILGGMKEYPSLRNAINKMQKIVSGWVDGNNDKHSSVIEAFFNGDTGVLALRDHFNGLSPYECSEVFRWLYENIDRHVDESVMADCILVIGEELSNSTTGIFPDVSLVSALIKIREIKCQTA